MSEDKDGSKKNIWLVGLTLIGYSQHQNLIGNTVKRKWRVGTKEAKCSRFEDIKQGDIVVYYDKHSGLVVGIFTVTSNRSPPRVVRNWTESVTYDIEPYELPLYGNYLDLKKLVTDYEAEFDFTRSFCLEEFSQENACTKLTERDFRIIRNALSDYSYLRRKEDLFPSQNEVDVMSTLLDFYGSRATSFASLFIASIFGLVTFLAIMRNIPEMSIYLFFVSLCPYFAFLGVGWYTWERFSYYGEIAVKIESNALRIPFYSKLSKITLKGDFKKKNEETTLYEFIVDMDRKQREFWLKKLVLANRKILSIVLFIVILALTLVAYWDILTPILFGRILVFWKLINIFSH